MSTRVESAEHSSPKLSSPVEASKALPGANHKRPRGVQYLARRANGNYLFVRRYPAEYLERGIFAQPAYRKSLNTKDRLTAEKRVRQLAARFDRIMDWLSTRYERPGAMAVTAARSVVRSDDVAVIAKRFEALLLHSDDLERTALSSGELREYVSLAETQRSQVLDLNSRGDFDAFTEEVRGFLTAEGLQCAEETPVWSELLKQMTQAQLRALRGVAQRLAGNEVSAPEAPPPVRGADDLDDLDVAFEHWVQKAGPMPKTIIEARSIYRRLKLHGGQTRISAIDRATMLTFQAAESQRVVKGHRIKPQTVNKMMGLVSAIFALACDDLLSARRVANPLAKMRKQKVRNSDIIEKQDLSEEELRKFFQGPVHAGRARPVGGAGEAAFWLPILGLTTGARMRELAQLSVHEVVVRDGVTCLWLTNREDDEKNIEHLTADERERLFKKSLKTGDSRRIVPVHSTVLALGFMDYVQTLREARSPALFPDLRVDCHGNVAGNFSKWFNLYLSRVGIKIRGLDWISFRHTLKTAMREAHIPQDVADYLEGHRSLRAAQDYGGFPAKTMREHIEKLAFPVLLEIPQWVSRPLVRPAKP